MEIVILAGWLMKIFRNNFSYLLMKFEKERKWILRKTSEECRERARERESTQRESKYVVCPTLVANCSSLLNSGTSPTKKNRKFTLWNWRCEGHSTTNISVDMHANNYIGSGGILQPNGMDPLRICSATCMYIGNINRLSCVACLCTAVA